MNDNAQHPTYDNREHRINRVAFAFLLSIPVFFFTPFFMAGRQATNAEVIEKYKYFLGWNQSTLLNFLVFSCVVCLLAYYWYKLKLNRPTSFVFKTFGSKIGFIVFIAATSVLLLMIKRTVFYLMSKL
jgi:hypothetical protein